eukprot:6838459-Prymnesium_polylepis.2
MNVNMSAEACGHPCNKQWAACVDVVPPPVLRLSFVLFRVLIVPIVESCLLEPVCIRGICCACSCWAMLPLRGLRVVPHRSSRSS